jgi:hypothetical protein
MAGFSRTHLIFQLVHLGPRCSGDQRFIGRLSWRWLAGQNFRDSLDIWVVYKWNLLLIEPRFSGRRDSFEW